MDSSNLAARLKWPEDFIVRRGYLKDDNPDVLNWVRREEQIVDPKCPGYVLIQIKPIC